MIYLNKNNLLHIPYHKNRAIHQKMLQKYSMSQPQAKNKRFVVTLIFINLSYHVEMSNTIKLKTSGG